MAAWSKRARATPELVPIRSSVSPTKANQLVARPRVFPFEPLVMPMICACTPAMNAPWGVRRGRGRGTVSEAVTLKKKSGMRDTHDGDEGVYGVQECLVAIGLSLEVFQGSLNLELVEETSDGGELIACRCFPRQRVVSATNPVRCHSDWTTLQIHGQP
ncbi:hypothetical protein F5148DRAFT_1166880 [Russula earlei]|uniref:Uncharacterized protein n=1 Tax=Russula earlei TaxID=71964 RepID=A0ACC0UKB7_9AGAM|nr:hypothetical protein F5148DRAFT_1166880 [Russula earlei]